MDNAYFARDVTAQRCRSKPSWPGRLPFSRRSRRRTAPRDLDIGHSQIRLQIVCLHLRTLVLLQSVSQSGALCIPSLFATDSLYMDTWLTNTA